MQSHVLSFNRVIKCSAAYNIGIHRRHVVNPVPVLNTVISLSGSLDVKKFAVCIILFSCF